MVTSSADPGSSVLRLLAAAPALGVALRSPAGPARDAWLAALRAQVSGPWRRMPSSIDPARLLGGIDLAGTLQAGRLVQDAGLLAEVAGGMLVVSMAERMSASLAAILATAMDEGGFGVVLLDEGIGDEQPPAALLDRCALLLALPHHWVLADAPSGTRTPCPEDDALTAIGAAALRLGVWPMRPVIAAMAAARAAAAGRALAIEDVALAAQLVLAPRATQAPPMEDAAPDQTEPETAPPDPGGEEAEGDDCVPTPTDAVLAAAAAALPPGLLAGLVGADAARPMGGAGRAGETRTALRGRPAGTRAGDPRRGERLDLIATLRAAAPWQRVRNRVDRVEIRRDDFRTARRQARTETTTIFVVDASGSQALNRLAEAKGAVELLLGESYVRRDRVAVLAFRGKGASLLLPPTRSLVRAKRELAQLPGGGGTPLASGIAAGLALADAVRARGGTPTLVLLTDGRANVTRAGTGGRAVAEAEATTAARLVRAAGVRAVLIDTSPRPHPAARAMAGAMGARYVPLPYAGAAALTAAVRG